MHVSSHAKLREATRHSSTVRLLTGPIVNNGNVATGRRPEEEKVAPVHVRWALQGIHLVRYRCQLCVVLQKNE
jgi:hypothetical protein